jgi:FMN phosphatase YigB (HAD superfamily)
LPQLTKYEIVIFDFNGVLSHDHFYNNPQYRRLQQEFPGVYEFIQTHIFETENMVNTWMRNQMTATDVNRYIAENTAIDLDTLSQILLESVACMTIEQRLIEIILRLKQSGVLVALVTDNMDVFSQITIKNYYLDDIFHAIVNSSDYGILKSDNHGQLFDIAHDQLNSKERYSRSLLIDDSARARTVYEVKGGKTYPYTSYENFAVWATNHLVDSDV